MIEINEWVKTTSATLHEFHWFFHISWNSKLQRCNRYFVKKNCFFVVRWRVSFWLGWPHWSLNSQRRDFKNSSGQKTQKAQNIKTSVSRDFQNMFKLNHKEAESLMEKSTWNFLQSWPWFEDSLVRLKSPVYPSCSILMRLRTAEWGDCEMGHCSKLTWFARIAVLCACDFWNVWNVSLHGKCLARRQLNGKVVGVKNPQRRLRRCEKNRTLAVWPRRQTSKAKYTYFHRWISPGKSPWFGKFLDRTTAT